MQDMDIFVRAHAEPIPSASPYAQFKVMELAKEHAVVTLDGQGADEELAGYHYFFGFYFKDLLKKFRMPRLVSEMVHYTRGHKSFYGYLTFIYFLLPLILRTKLRGVEKGYISNDFYGEYAPKTKISSELYGSKSLNDALLNHFEYKLEHLLKWEDRNSMFFSLEARVPFLDYRLVEKILSMSSDLVINKGMTKHILRQAMKDILPEPICKRKDKIGFGTPQDEWFRTVSFSNYIIELIRSESFKSRKVWDTQSIEKTYQKHLAGKANQPNEIWKWIHLEKWYRAFID
jgi:asparagine synthase (glutamine-hydrolysing)